MPGATAIPGYPKQRHAGVIGRLHQHPREDRGAFAHARVLVLHPPERDLSPLLGKTNGARHGLGSVYPNVAHLEATLRLLEDTPEIVIPRDNRRLVERALHPEALAVVIAGNPAWRNHVNERAGGDHAAAETARRIALNLSQPFRTLTFADVEEEAATRLDARDLLVDLPEPLASPFGDVVTRIAIPHHMARGIGARDEPQLINARSFQIGDRRFGYDQWGLHTLT